MSNVTTLPQSIDPIEAFASRLPNADLWSREEIAEALNESTQTLANRENRGRGIGRIVRIGKRVFHYRADVLEWLKKRLKVERSNDSEY